MKDLEKEKKYNGLSRRDFLSRAAALSAGFAIVPGKVVSGAGNKNKKMPSDTLNVAGVGVGGRGAGVLRPMTNEINVVALCDVDWRYSQPVFEEYPDAKKYRDWRIMFDEMGEDIDAVVVATSDHAHAVVAAHAMTMGKHVYVEKPLTHTIYESRLLTKLAAEYKVATQMGDQGASGEGINLITEWIQNGVIGEVTKIEAFTDRPIWPQGLNPPEEQPVPEFIDWDLFIGPAQMRPYNEIYTPWNFRGWWDFGTGALGDMACHILHAPFKSLELGYPVKAQGSSTLLLKDAAPNAERVRLTYPQRDSSFGRLPEVEVNWYDGGLQPLKPKSWPEGRDMNHRGGGVLIHGTEDVLVHGCYGSDPWLLSGNEPSVPQTERRVKISVGDGEVEGEDAHYLDWVRACKESPENRVETKSSFDKSGPFNEMVLMGVLAVRLQNLNKELEWDGEKMKFTNINPNEFIQIVIEDGFNIEDGHPTFNQERTDPINALQFANGLIKKRYRDGWNLPGMPA